MTRLNAPGILPLLAALLVSGCGFPEDLPGQETWKTDFSKTTVDMDEIVSGGPPKDGIPAIDDPTYIVVFFTPETVSSVDAREISESRAVGSSAVYERTVDGRELTFEPTDESGQYRDEQTGSTWNFAGLAVGGELEGAQLTEVPHGNHFWFAWAAFRPETEVWGR